MLVQKKKQSIAFNGIKEEWDDFMLACKLEDKTASGEVRIFLRKYLEDKYDLIAKYKENEAKFKKEIEKNEQ